MVFHYVPSGDTDPNRGVGSPIMTNEDLVDYSGGHSSTADANVLPTTGNTQLIDPLLGTEEAVSDEQKKRQQANLIRVMESLESSNQAGTTTQRQKDVTAEFPIVRKDAGKSRAGIIAGVFAGSLVVGLSAWVGIAGNSQTDNSAQKTEVAAPSMNNNTGQAETQAETNQDAIVPEPTENTATSEAPFDIPFVTPIPPVEPVEFSVPSAVSIGDAEGCGEVARPTFYSTVYKEGKNAGNSSSYAKAVINENDYWVQIPRGGMQYALNACGLNSLPVSAESGEVSLDGVVQQVATIDVRQVAGNGQIIDGSNLTMLSRGQYYSKVKGAPENVCETLYETNPDCSAITTLSAEQQNDVFNSLKFIATAAIEGTCTDQATKAVKDRARSTIKSVVSNQQVDPSNVSVSFTGLRDISFMSSQLKASMGGKSLEDRLAMFPDISEGNLVVKCNAN